MSSNQFIRECNQRFAAEKEKAHRKQVMQKKSKSFGSEKTWSIEKCISDNSAGKMSTHRYLQSLFESDQSFSIGSLLQKRDLVLLCKAYGIQSSKFQNKTHTIKYLKEHYTGM